MWAVNADRHRSDVEWRTCEPGPGQSKTAERGQNALRVWMMHKSERWAGEGSMRESRGKRRSHASACNAAGSWYANSSARSERPVVPTTQYYRLFLATVSAKRSLWNGTIRSGSEVAAHPSTANSLHGAGSFFKVWWLLYWSRNSLHLGNQGVQWGLHKNPPLRHTLSQLNLHPASLTSE